MTPLTRKENYLNEIVGWGNTAPEKPLTPEELFFAAILGEAVQAPEPLTRYQMYLAKIAGRDIEIPTPITRLEYFLAKAAGMDITVPVPITREEIYWSNYTAIVEFEVENVPPLTYKAIEGTLNNYRIYGNTVNGENVGDLITEGEHAGEYEVPVTVEGKNLFDYSSGITYSNSTLGNTNMWSYSSESTGTVLRIPCSPNTIYSLSISENIIHTVFRIATVDSDNVPISGQDGYIPCTTLVNDGSLNAATFITPDMAKYLLFQTNTGVMIDTMQTLMLNAGSSALPYEPYHAPVTTPIYLPEPIKMVGDEAEYIDFMEQKQHFADGTSTDVLLPTLPTLSGTNTLSVGTEVQPSKVYVKYEGARE